MLFTNDGFVRVDDRCLKIDGIKAKRTAEDGFNIELNLDFSDEARLPEELPLIEEVFTNQQVK